MPQEKQDVNWKLHLLLFKISFEVKDQEETGQQNNF